MTVPPEHLAGRPAPPADLTGPPQDFADPPPLTDAEPGVDGRPHDLLSELLRSVRLTGERIVAYAPPRTCSIGFAGTGALHIVDEGELVLRIDGDHHVERLGRGDVILIPRGDPHHISDAPEDDAPAPAPARWLCGTFTIGDPQASHLLASYLAHVRLDAASDLLRDTALPVALIAENVGYTSEAAFSRAFKRRYDVPPARWRADVRARRS
jgi:hypothetical protein